jgi:hypothetical protein
MVNVSGPVPGRSSTVIAPRIPPCACIFAAGCTGCVDAVCGVTSVRSSNGVSNRAAVKSQCRETRRELIFMSGRHDSEAIPLVLPEAGGQWTRPPRLPLRSLHCRIRAGEYRVDELPARPRPQGPKSPSGASGLTAVGSGTALTVPKGEAMGIRLLALFGGDAPDAHCQTPPGRRRALDGEDPVPPPTSRAGRVACNGMLHAVTEAQHHVRTHPR